MKKHGLAVIALLLAAALLAGCSDAGDYFEAVQQAVEKMDYVAYEDMEYTRPDTAAVEQTLSDACQAAAGTDIDQILDKIYTFYDAYDDFYTNYALADIRYSGDLTDIYWETEYNYCVENSASVDAALEELYYALAASPCREALEGDDYFGQGFFDGYEGENLWGVEYTAMLEQEAQLENRYYALAAQALEQEFGSESYYENGGNEMIEVLVELIGLRQEMAAYWGYSGYAEFATDCYYYRDYSIGETEAYLDGIRQELVPLYREIYQSPRWNTAYAYCSEAETFAYVEKMARNMGGTVEEAFDLLEQAGLYDISYGKNKFDSSFEVYLTSYAEPFIFMNPTVTVYDCLTFAHEFGHFCNDYASWGSYAGVDVMEFFSQGMEYLSLCYGEDGENLTWLKMADGLSLYVEQAAFASFEMRMYDLTGEDLTAENLCALYDEVALSYGFDSGGYDSREFVTINHYYTNPMYIVSYVVSNDAALQLYQMEQEKPGAGLRCLEDNLDTQCAYFLEFLDEAGLESPFTPGRIETVRQTFENVLK